MEKHQQCCGKACTGSEFKAELEPLKQVIKTLGECASTCQSTLMHCLAIGGKHAEIGHVRALMDCSEACAVAACFASRVSPLCKEHIRIAYDACNCCADNCREFKGDQTVEMKHLIDLCTQCQSVCRPHISNVAQSDEAFRNKKPMGEQAQTQAQQAKVRSTGKE